MGDATFWKMCTWLAQSSCFAYLGVQQPQSLHYKELKLVFEGWRLEIWKCWSVRRRLLLVGKGDQCLTRQESGSRQSTGVQFGAAAAGFES